MKLNSALSDNVSVLHPVSPPVPDSGGAKEEYILLNIVDSFSRWIRAGREAARRHAASGDGNAGRLRDASVQLDVAATVYRLILEQSDGGTVSLSNCLAKACAVALEPLQLRRRAALEFFFGPDCTVPAAKALPVVAVAMEAILNALHHAHPAGLVGHLSISCRRDGGFVVVMIGDDGVGLSEGFQPERDAGAGMGSMFEAARAVGARLAFDSGPLGLTVRVKMPAADNPATEGTG